MTEREILKWVTINGKHIPIYADGINDEYMKEYQIAKNNQAKDELNADKDDNNDLYVSKDLFATDDEIEIADEYVKIYRETSGFSNPTEYVKKYTDLSPEEYAQKKLESFPKDGEPEVRKIYTQLVGEEKEVTDSIKSIADDTGMELKGLDARLKEGDSFNRKIMNMVRQQGISPKEAASNVEDAIRYTTISSPKDLVGNYNKMVNAMRDKGFELSLVENNFTDKRTTLNSVAAYFKNKNGHTVEIWFHTPYTYKTLSDIHKYYEALRVRQKFDTGGAILERTLWRKFYENIEFPDNIKSIKSTGTFVPYFK